MKKFRIDYYRKWIIGLLLLCPFLILIYIKSIDDPKKLESNHRYTIGKIINKSSPADGGEMADFNYYVNESSYQSSFSIDYTNDIKVIAGQRYFVKFYPPDPTICYILIDKLVPDTVSQAPSEGWGSLDSISNK